MNFAAQLTKMIDAGLGREVSPPETNVAIGYHTEYTDIADAAIASFQTNIEAPLKALSVAMEPIQSGSGDPSPDNVRPISGRQSVTVTRAGVNVWDGEWDSGQIDNTTGQNKNGQNIRSKNYISCLPDTSYYFKSSSMAGGAFFYFYDANQIFISGNVSVARNAPFVTPQNAYFMRYYEGASYGTTYNNDISINYPSTDHDYHASDIQSITIPLGQTVYGGTVDAVSGVMTVTWGETNLGSLTWTMLSDSIGNFFRADASYIKPIPSGDISTMKCSIYKTVSSSNVVDKSIARSTGTTNYLYCRDNSYADAASFTAAIDGVQLVYELARPVTVQLTAQQLTTLLGTNNVWSDSGNVLLTYGENVYTEGY